MTYIIAGITACVCLWVAAEAIQYLCVRDAMTTTNHEAQKGEAVK